MASVIKYLDKRKALKDGTFPLKLAVTHKNTFMIPLKINLKPEQWENGIVVNHPRDKFFNKVIKNRFVSVENALINIKPSKLRSMTDKGLKEFLIAEGKDEESENIPETPSLLFKDHAREFISIKTKKSTKEIYQHTLNKIAQYTDLNTLTFEDIDYSWLEKFNVEMSKTCKVNTRSIHFRNIRAIFKHATKKKLVSKDLYPFEDFHIKEEETQHRNLSVDDLILIRDYPVEPHQERYRDLFMLLFYTIGINMIDILHATWLNGDRLEYRREKTGRLYSVEIIPEAKKIIEKYSPGKKYLLNFLDDYANYKDFLHRTNDNLKEIGPYEWVEAVTKTGRKTKKKKRQPLFPFLTTYYARHTWATIADSLNIPQDTIKKALGHGKKTTTDIYINFDRKKIDAANRKIASYLNNKSK